MDKCVLPALVNPSYIYLLNLSEGSLDALCTQQTSLYFNPDQSGEVVSGLLLQMSKDDEDEDEQIDEECESVDEHHKSDDTDDQSLHLTIPTLILSTLDQLVNPSSSTPSSSSSSSSLSLPDPDCLKAIFTHNHAYHISEFSPDGQWFVTASETVCFFLSFFYIIIS